MSGRIGLDGIVDTGGRSRRRTRRGAGLAVIAVVLAFLATACPSNEPNTQTSSSALGSGLEADETPTPGGKLVMAVTAETNGWNPATSQWADAGNFVGSSVLEPLTTFDADGNYLMWLAESVEPTTPGDLTRWTIKIKPGITFHDGSPLDAEVVKANLDVYRGTYYTDTTTLSSIALKSLFSDVVVKDPLTVEVILTTPWSAFPADLGGPSGYMMARSMIDSPNKGVNKPVGTGPFVFESWEPDKSFLANKNPNYWRKDDQGRPLPRLDAVEFKPIVDAKQRVAALQTGDIDMLLTTRAEDVSDLKDEYTVVKDYNSEKTIVMLNTAEDPTKAKNPFKNVHARRALALGTNRAAIQQLIGGAEEIEESTVPQVASSRWAMDESTTGYYAYDPAKAREEIEVYKRETGYTDFTFTFSGLASLEDQRIMQALQQQWAELGITAEIETIEQQAYIGQITLGGYQAAYFRNFGYIDPDSNYVFLHSSTAKGLGTLSINFYQYGNADNDKALDAARETDDFQQRKQYYETSSRNINDAAINLWLFNTPYAIIADPQVRGLNQARTQGFGNFLPKPWFWETLWRKR
jgi:peptide/nickel transport system substrate-binding protein